MKREAFEKLADFTKTATVPLFELGEISTRAMEKVARHQFDFAREYFELATRQAQLLKDHREPKDWFAVSSELANEFGKKLTSRAEAFVQVANETRNELMLWAKDRTQVNNGPRPTA